MTFQSYSGTPQTAFINRRVNEVFDLCKNFKFVTENNLMNAIKFEEGFVPMVSGKKNEVANLVLQISVSF